MSILYVNGGDAFAREVFRSEGRGYWAAALPLALEKHGYLGVEARGTEVLVDRPALRAAGAVLIARLPETAWTPARVQAVVESGAAMFIEGPLPPALHDALGIRDAAPIDPSGTLSVGDSDLRNAAERFGVIPGGVVSGPQARGGVDRDPAMHWSAISSVPLRVDQAEAWRKIGWDAERWTVDPGADVLAQWEPTDGSGGLPAIVRRGSLVACSFGILSFIGQCHTPEPFAEDEYRSWPRILGVEAVVLGLIDLMHRAAAAPRVRVKPWPSAVEWVLNVRHDFDRALDTTAISEVLARHGRAGTSATWYWRARHLGRGTGRADRQHGTGANAGIRLVAGNPRHEVALHTEGLWRGSDAERRTIEDAAGVALAGSAAHGDPNCFRYQGAPNLLWVDKTGLDYTEFLQHAHYHPHRAALLAADGSISTAHPICLAHHESFDRSTRPGDTAADHIRKLPETYRRVQGMLQVLNHPDINVEELFEVLAEYPRDGRLDLTAAEVADWWRRTHVSGELTIEAASGGAFRVTSRRGVQGVVLEVLEPDGSTRLHTLYLAPGKPATIDASTIEYEADVRAGGPRDWQRDIGPVFSEAVTHYFVAQGLEPNAPEVISSAKTNNELVPQRAGNLLRLLRDLAEVPAIRGLRILELGSGFGALASYLSWWESPHSFVAIDMREDFVATARECVRRVGLDDGVRFEAADMRSLEGIGASSFDVVIANNALPYLVSDEDLRKTLEAVHRVLVPHGVFLLHHANKWRLRDPFTGAPLIHLLPPFAARGLARVTGWRHNHGRVRLVSAPALRRRLRAQGFTDVRIGSVGSSRRRRALRTSFGGFYAMAGRKASN